MNKIAILGDLHFGMKNGNENILNYQRKFFEQVFFPYLLDNDIKILVQLGDLFDNPKHIQYNTLKQCREFFFDKLKEYSIETHIIIGNHDKSNKHDLSINSPELLIKDIGYYDNISIYSNPSTINISNIKFDLIPWVCKDNEEQIFEFIKKSKSKYCFAHPEINGLRFSKYGIECSNGMDKKLFKKYHKVFAGHFHYKQEKDNILYIGQPYQDTWASLEEEKGFFVLDEIRLEYIKNFYRLYHKIEYTDNLKLNYEEYKDSYVKLIVLEKENKEKFKEYVDKLNEICYNVNIIEKEFLVENNNENFVIESKNTLEIWNEYISNIELNGLDKEYLKIRFEELYREAENL